MQTTLTGMAFSIGIMRSTLFKKGMGKQKNLILFFFSLKV